MSFLMRLKQEDMRAGKEGRLVCFVQYLQESVRLTFKIPMKTVCPPQCHRQSVVLIWASVTSSSAVNSGYEIILKSEIC